MSESPPSSVTRYLQKRALTGPWQLEGHTDGRFKAAVVIPAHDEETFLPQTLKSLAKNPEKALGEVLIVVVVNNSQDAPVEMRMANMRTLDNLRMSGSAPAHLNIAWIDAASPGRELPARDAGVGLARKIGFDSALPLLDHRSPSSFLVSLDADTLVDPKYLPALLTHFNTERRGGAVLPFLHSKAETQAQNLAIERYELYLRHYVLGLSLAGSPYAYHTVGSAMAFTAAAYISAGGMNRRRGGEDFYFLQQLAKTTGIAEVRGTIVRPSPRPSHRVPFGTGPSVARQMRGDNAAVLFYPAESFNVLGIWLNHVDQNWQSPSNDLLESAGEISSTLVEYLAGLDFCNIWDRLKANHDDSERFMKAFHEWFDGLKTLKLIHYLCDKEFSRGEPHEMLPRLMNWAGLEESDKIGKQIATLRRFQLQGTIESRPNPLNQ